MARRFVNVDRETRMLLPVDMRDWVPEDDLVHFVIEAVEMMDLGAAKVNRRGSGSKQYPPGMMLSLLIYCYANGIMASRKIERATYRDLVVRYLTGDTHPDHDTICTFRRENGELVQEAFEQVLRLAKQMGLVKLGTVAVDGTQVKANASKHKSVRYDRAGELEEQLRADVKELLERAEASDANPVPGEQRLPQEIRRRELLLEKMVEARRELERRAREQESDEGGDEGEGGEGSSGAPEASQQINLTDAESALMRKNRQSGYEQAYNAQAVVDGGGSQLVLGRGVIDTPSDANQLEAALESVPESMVEVRCLLADAGYANAEAIERVGKKVDLYVAIAAEDNSYRRYDFRPVRKKAGKRVKDPRLVAMRDKVRSEEGKRIYGKRCSTVEPVFGIIKSAMGLRQFLLRGLEKVRIEWDIACLAYNVRRMWTMVNT